MKQIDNTEELQNEFQHEVDMLDKFRSEYLIHFYGAVIIPNKICMVTEFAKCGSLDDLIYKSQHKISIQLKIKLLLDCFKILLDCARGIKYLHDNRILHRDIKPDNFLVVSLDENVPVNCKLTDFGSSRNMNMLMTNMTFTKGIGTPKYMAPEILKREKYKKPADIYSFAITMVEVITFKDPFPSSQFKYAWDIADFISDGKRPDIIDMVDDHELLEIIEMSWKQLPSERIQIQEIVEKLESIYNK